MLSGSWSPASPAKPACQLRTKSVQQAMADEGPKNSTGILRTLSKIKLDLNIIISIIKVYLNIM